MARTLETVTDPNTGKTTVVLTDANRNVLARAKDTCLQITMGEKGTKRADTASEAADALGTLLEYLNQSEEDDAED